MSDLLTAVSGPAISAADNAVQYYNQKNLNRQAKKDTQENMRLAQQLNLESAYKAIAQSTSALRAAGLNPAMASDGKFSATGVSAPAGSAGSAAPSRMADALAQSKELSLLDVQKENIKAQTAKLKAETQETEERTPTHKQNIAESESRVVLNDKQRERMESEIQKIGAETLDIAQDYKRKLDEDSKATDLIRNYYSFKASKAESQAEKDFWSGMAENANELSVGTFRAMRDWSAYINDLDDYDRQMLFRAMQKQILNMQIADDSVMYDLAHMPQKEFEKILAEIGDLTASRDFRIAAKDIGIPAEAEYKQQISKTTRHNDFVGNIKDGNYSDAAWSQLPNLLGLVEHGLMLKYLKGGFGSVSSSASVPYSSMNPKEIQRQLELSNDKIKALQQAKRSAEKNKKLGEAYRERKALEERLRNFRGRDYMQ